MLRPSTSMGLSEAYLRPPPLLTSTSSSNKPATPTTPSGGSDEYLIQSVSPSDDGRNSPFPPGFDPTVRRPSLPQLHAQPGDYNTAPARGRNVVASPVLRRPRSAGTGFTRNRDYDQAEYGRQRLCNKYSLLNLFKKGQPGEVLPDGTMVPLPDSSPPPLPPSPFPSSTSLGSPRTSSERPSTAPLTPSSSPRFPFRNPRSSDASTKPRNAPQPRFIPTSSPPPGPHIALAVDLHNAMQQQVNGRRDRSRSGTGARSLDRFGTESEVTGPSSNSPRSRFNFLRKVHHRDRSGSSGSLGGAASPHTPGNRNGAVFDDDVLVLPRSHSSNNSDSGPLMATPQGILRSNGRTDSSNGQSPSPVPQTPSGQRSLRFHNNSNSSLKWEGPIDLRSANSPSSIGQRKPGDLPEIDTASSITVLPKVPESASPGYNYSAAPPISRNLSDRPGYEEDEEPEDYGQPLRRDAIANGEPLKAEFPFSLNYPPVDEAESVPPIPLRIPPRSRDSVGSMGTPDSRGNPRLSLGGMTSGGSTLLDTPPPVPSKDVMQPKESASKRGSLASAPTGSPSKHSINERRGHVPPDMDLTAISSHAQAEALVQRAQQDILELAQQAELDVPGSSAGFNKTPLSARLAAYGESLAIERKLREQKRMDGASAEPVDPARVEAAYTVLVKKTSKEALGSMATPRPSLGMDRSPSRPIGGQYGHGVGTQMSVGRAPPPVKLRLKSPKRPATADPLMSKRNNTSFEFGRRSHHSAGSTTGAYAPGTVIEQEFDEASENHPPALSRHHHPLYDPSGRRYYRVHGNPSDSDLEEPEGEFERGGKLSRINSLDNLEPSSRGSYDIEKPTGHSTTSLITPSMREKKDRVRSANKLTRMGFSPAELAGRVPSSQPVVLPTGRFGAIKSFFKGK
ncbi:hypothetical protein BDN72DRAFT_398194 [Pluteus cervinus]|uniref:Uncharacterized protein n=1 Tax=Pluteus cervinus TaxID=181527 RepID=A0ACD3A9P1_9AGAR|nr:hypothetical protein BDN72DRAFT_398194 [Pluteus cervinus]